MDEHENEATISSLHLIESDNDNQDEEEDVLLRHKLHALNLAEGKGNTRRSWAKRKIRRESKGKNDDYNEVEGCNMDGDSEEQQRPAGGIRLAVRKRMKNRRERRESNNSQLHDGEDAVQDNDFASTGNGVTGPPLDDGNDENGETAGSRNNTPLSDAASYLELAPTASLETLATTATADSLTAGNGGNDMDNTTSLPVSHLPAPASSSSMTRTGSAPLALVESIASSSLFQSSSGVQDAQRTALTGTKEGGGSRLRKRSDTVRSFILSKADTLRFPGLSGNAAIEEGSPGEHVRFHRRKPIDYTTTTLKHKPTKRRHRKISSNSRNSNNIEEEEETDLILDTLKEAGYKVSDLGIKEEWATDILYENQRGISMLGNRYGANALFPWDDSHWTKLDASTGNITDSPYDIINYPLPTPAWHWHHSEWLVNMAGDVDSEGFSYSTRFGSAFWRGIPSITFFVRRRMWIRSRYRPAISSRELTKLSEPSHSTSSHPHVSSKKSPSSTNRSPKPILSPPSASIGEFPSPQLAHHLSLTNPFLSWYDDEQQESKEYHKEDLIHANFIRISKVLVRRTTVDRERLACWQYWLKERKELIHNRQMTDSEEHREETSREDVEEDRGEVDGDEEEDPQDRNQRKDDKENWKGDRPDLRDVWDLLEDRLDSLLQLFEYQDTRRVFLTLLSQIHDSSHPSHRYLNRSTEIHGPVELSPTHQHGDEKEMGGQISERSLKNAEHGVGKHDRRRGERLDFIADVRRRLEELNGSQNLTASGAKGDVSL